MQFTQVIRHRNGSRADIGLLTSKKKKLKRNRKGSKQHRATKKQQTSKHNESAIHLISRNFAAVYFCLSFFFSVTGDEELKLDGSLPANQ